MYNNVIHRQSSQTAADSESCVLQTLIRADVSSVSQPQARQSLLQLIRQHQNQTGWILLVAPASLPDKEWAEYNQLSLHNVLVVHQKQISDLTATLVQALTSTSCKVVINFGQPLEQQQLIKCQQLAVKNSIWFYQSEHLAQPLLKH